MMKSESHSLELKTSLFSCLLNFVWLCDPMDCSLPGSSVLRIFQARILKWVATSYPRGSWPRGQTWVSCVSCIGRRILYHCTTWEAPERMELEIKKISSFMKGRKRSRENQIKLTLIWDLFTLGVLMGSPAGIQLFKLGAADNQAKESMNSCAYSLLTI